MARLAGAVFLGLVVGSAGAQADKPATCAVPQLADVAAAVPATGASAWGGVRRIAPYTLTQMETEERNYANGLTFSDSHEIHLARNSAGWTRDDREMPIGGELIINGKVMGPPSEKQRRVFINFGDQHKNLTWVEGSREQHVATLSTRNSPPLPPIVRPQPPKRESQGPFAQRTSEDLGTKTIEGVIVKGTRWTTIYPANFNGNNMPYREVQETWTSRDFGLPLEVTTETAQGKSHWIVTSFTPGEPDAALFQPPGDYVLSCQVTTLERIGETKP